MNEEVIKYRKLLTGYALGLNKYLTREIISEWSNERLFRNIHPYDRDLLGDKLFQIGFLKF